MAWLGGPGSGSRKLLTGQLIHRPVGLKAVSMALCVKKDLDSVENILTHEGNAILHE
jgi:hypothetical protein